MKQNIVICQNFRIECPIHHQWQEWEGEGKDPKGRRRERGKPGRGRGWCKWEKNPDWVGPRAATNVPLCGRQGSTVPFWRRLRSPRWDLDQGRSFDAWFQGPHVFSGHRTGLFCSYRSLFWAPLGFPSPQAGRKTPCVGRFLSVASCPFQLLFCVRGSVFRLLLWFDLRMCF